MNMNEFLNRYPMIWKTQIILLLPVYTASTSDAVAMERIHMEGDAMPFEIILMMAGKSFSSHAYRSCYPELINSIQMKCNDKTLFVRFYTF